MIDLELPLKKRSQTYRFFETLPAILSIGAIILLIVLSFISPLIAAVYLLVIIVTMLVKTVGMTVHTIRGHKRLERATKIDWHRRLTELQTPAKSYQEASQSPKIRRKEFGHRLHVGNLRLMAAAPEAYPKPSQLYNAVIIAAYNETYEVLKPTLESVRDTAYDNHRLIVVIAYEERGGSAIEATAKRLQREFKGVFKDFYIVKHPKNLPNEIIGKGGNITHAGKFLRDTLEQQGVPLKDVMVTTLDSDNRPHKAYFDYVMYEYIVHSDRKHLAYQPVALFLNNIWDVPAPMRVVATGNSFWNLISSMRPHSLQNFASHSQPLDALSEMDFWSTRSIVEDGHQYWRSYFYFNGDYSVVPIYAPIYQDAVLSDTYRKTLKAQFVQLRRWAYGASDVPYVAVRLFSKKQHEAVPFGATLVRFLRLLDGHVTRACIPILIAVGGWVPLLLNSQAARDVAAHQLPDVVSRLQQFALIGLFVVIFLSFKMLPPRPERYKRRRNLLMILQWLLMPITAVIYGSISAYNAQIRLLLGKYLDKFDVTEKATQGSIERAKQRKQRTKNK